MDEALTQYGTYLLITNRIMEVEAADRICMESTQIPLGEIQGKLGGPNFERQYLDRVAVTRAEKWYKMPHYFPTFW